MRRKKKEYNNTLFPSSRGLGYNPRGVSHSASLGYSFKSWQEREREIISHNQKIKEDQK